jgi:hypothetical protein
MEHVIRIYGYTRHEGQAFIRTSTTVFNITINGLIAIRLKGAGSRLFEYTDWAIEWSFRSPENLKAKEIALVQAIGLQRRNVAWRTKD